MAHGGVTDDGEGPFTPARRKRHPPLCWSKPSRTPAESERRPAGRVWLRYVPRSSQSSDKPYRLVEPWGYVKPQRTSQPREDTILASVPAFSAITPLGRPGTELNKEGSPLRTPQTPPPSTSQGSSSPPTITGSHRQRATPDLATPLLWTCHYICATRKPGSTEHFVPEVTTVPQVSAFATLV
ncbi:hypothetical protein HBH56_147890 [Parastagonospora nodorum]|nr:hypothetical protein HBH56_147890 [Parastagonospora nodorum]KAH3923311.1 hypothetical protein HBH54_212530 [Parastagonospora nodorum]KAH3946155.1 hypothetical protein HBH53_135350 [Parastagonospora nodorum]KAH4028746.1 hypothetical protein HBI13_039760 [Parastagonospora nodorum]KAH4037640.1 hypothetical protein HBI09_056950 [Parastagonospora nodorum]